MSTIYTWWIDTITPAKCSFSDEIGKYCTQYSKITAIIEMNKSQIKEFQNWSFRIGQDSKSVFLGYISEQ